MLRNLTIQNYRCFENFHMDGLERVNLFVGNNNSGKTSLLEAIYLFVEQNKYHALIDVLLSREEIIEDTYNNRQTLGSKTYIHIEPIKHIFYNHKFASGYDIRMSSNIINNISANLLISRAHQSLYVSNWVDNKPEKKQSISIPLIKNNILELNDNTFSYYSNNNIYLSKNKETTEQLVIFWDNIYLTKKENKVVESLQILEPKIERIGFFKQGFYNIVRLKFSGQEHPIPLTSMGEGMYRILVLAMSLVTAENGVLLVDEIETGLHYEAQTDMWRLILETAKELNVQVFATTHSWDCIAAFQEALSQVEDSSIGKLFRLDSKYGKLRAVEYDAEDLDIAVRNSIEVR